MAQKKKQQDAGVPVTKKPSLVQKWNDYFKKGDLNDWQRLCADLGLPDDLPSKRQCRIVSLLFCSPHHRPKKRSLLTLSLRLGSRVGQCQHQTVPERKVKARGGQVLQLIQRPLQVHQES